MKKAMVMILGAAMGSGAWAKGVTPGPAVAVCMESNADATVDRAQLEASAIFSEVGVKIAWRSGRACSAADVIHIHLSDQTPASLKPGALAYARPYEGTYIEVFCDRVAKTAGAETLPHLLAHVLVHEITHILEGRAALRDGGNESALELVRLPADVRTPSAVRAGGRSTAAIGDGTSQRAAPRAEPDAYRRQIPLRCT